MLNYKAFSKKLRRKFWEFGLSKIFTPKAEETKGKIDELDFTQIRENEKVHYSLEENTYKLRI